MKQYRLKITWSNGDSEYVGKVIEQKDCAQAYQQIIDSLNMAHIKTIENWDSIVVVEHVRKFEFEEVITHKETDGKF